MDPLAHMSGCRVSTLLDVSAGVLECMIMRRDFCNDINPHRHSHLPKFKTECLMSYSDEPGP